MVARALRELANDSVNDGVLPKPMAAAMSGAAGSAAIRLEHFIAIKPGEIATEHARSLEFILADLEAMCHLARMIVTEKMNARNVAYVAMAVRYTADQAAKRLQRLDEDMDL
ncbi:hypothetical protein [Dyella amyloliquefaciens]|uniref:hypothetical protein n=1 Tax=Dyella amyloliquefaciens TaxID=1770545 RepID=UPI00102E709E|nr:hypothetical protein [Dyella amyloliquefaciens]